jgi:hypothetical protein
MVFLAALTVALALTLTPVSLRIVRVLGRLILLCFNQTNKLFAVSRPTTLLYRLRFSALP